MYLILTMKSPRKTVVLLSLFWRVPMFITEHLVGRATTGITVLGRMFLASATSYLILLVRHQNETESNRTGELRI